MLKEKNVCGTKRFHFPAKQGHFVGLQWDDYFQGMKSEEENTSDALSVSTLSNNDDSGELEKDLV